MNLGELLKPCPFCNGEMVFYRHEHVNVSGKKIVTQYYMHKYKNVNCVLEVIGDPFVLGAGDANSKEGQIGKLAEMWNERIGEANDI